VIASVAAGILLSVFITHAAEPVYAPAGALNLPDYREWVFLTSSLDLNYNEAVPGAGRQSLLVGFVRSCGHNPLTIDFDTGEILSSNS
jgi:hypothetical protein